ncbi:MAG: hypothetical protein QF609_06540 [Gammaproteobacteria bacterium]|nr:hypothetical protein [Gammaproteobacteria bacterium]HJP35718.1 hypothetical protein [Gammaproteobacteria bacterium]
MTPRQRRGIRRLVNSRSSRLAVANLALCISMHASGVDGTTIDELISRADEAETSFREAREADRREQSSVAAQRLRDAERVRDERTGELDAARIETLSGFSGQVPEAIEKQRAGGSSWTEIALEIGVHPSVIGIELIDPRPPVFDSRVPP